MPYRELVGALYLTTTTRFDIAYSASVLASKSTDYSWEHWIRAKQVLRYLKATRNQRLTIDGSSETKAYCDASHNTEPKARSQTGYMIMIGDYGTIAWTSQK